MKRLIDLLGKLCVRCGKILRRFGTASVICGNGHVYGRYAIIGRAV